ncbi:DUF1344 domain-containing protein [Mesorhizobium retamae]|uniref:DUF1344 domain-containing protein n=1 Tax=Mesorhizobium retamae TaxID=2912854 RepID=A0ABS9QGR1_9HYPH|nr:DUF1344 domain-containing protein [Mesorhizobium sp. IRAMC:0171]MCG7506592.1 DUF1344 domain-containing protein [Mesorhizobium sp. IRAMC:0171]
MNKITKTIVAAASVALFAASSAYAATVQGTIKSIDPDTKSFTLDDGKIYQLPAESTVDKLQVGIKVAVTVDDKTGIVTSIVKSS